MTADNKEPYRYRIYSDMDKEQDRVMRRWKRLGNVPHGPDVDCQVLKKRKDRGEE